MLYVGVGAAALSGGYLYLRSGTPTGQAGNAPPSEEAKKIPGQTGASAKKAFTGGEQGFLSLLLEKSEVINHNTKKLIFRLPEDDMESGLSVASAVITKYKGPEMQKPVIRPYTPVSDVGMSTYSFDLCDENPLTLCRSARYSRVHHQEVPQWPNVQSSPRYGAWPTSRYQGAYSQIPMVSQQA